MEPIITTITDSANVMQMAADEGLLILQGLLDKWMALLVIPVIFIARKLLNNFTWGNYVPWETVLALGAIAGAFTINNWLALPIPKDQLVNVGLAVAGAAGGVYGIIKKGAKVIGKDQWLQ